MGAQKRGRKERTAEEIAQVLYESEVYGFVCTANKHNVPHTTLHSWRKKIEADPKIRQRFDELMEIGTAEWADRVNRPIVGAISFLNRAMESLDPADPNAINSVANALKVMAEAKFASEVFSVFARKQGAGNDPSGRADAATGTGADSNGEKPSSN